MRKLQKAAKEALKPFKGQSRKSQEKELKVLWREKKQHFRLLLLLPLLLFFLFSLPRQLFLCDDTFLHSQLSHCLNLPDALIINSSALFATSSCPFTLLTGK